MSLADKLVVDLRKDFGEKSAYLAKDIPRRGGISSGSLALDHAIGPLGGLPRDRCAEFFGPESSGKTTLGLLAIRNFLDAQPRRGALILDTEHKLDSDRIRQLLGDERRKRLVVTYPDHIEEAQDIYTHPSLVSSGDIAIVLLDSIGGSPTKAVGEKSAEEGDFGNAKAVTRFARIAQGMAHKNECLTIGINQMRENFKPNDHSLNTPGGRGWKHACMLRVYLRTGKGRINILMGSDIVAVATTVAGRVYKNHLGGIEGREFSYWFYNTAYDGKPVGVDQAEEIERLAVATGVITRNRGWYYHDALPGGKVNGKDKLSTTLNADDALRKTLADATLEALRSDPHADDKLAGSDPDKAAEATADVPLIARDNVLTRGVTQ